MCIEVADGWKVYVSSPDTTWRLKNPALFITFDDALSNVEGVTLYLRRFKKGTNRRGNSNDASAPY